MNDPAVVGSRRLVLGIGVCLVAGFAVAAQPTGGAEVVVADAFGVPLGGAEVVLTSIAGYRVVGTTGAGGAARFTELVAGVYVVEAQRAGFRSGHAEVGVERSSVRVVRVVLAPLVPAGLAVVVVDPQGLALPGAAVTLAGPGGEHLEAVTGPAGGYEAVGLRPGPWGVRVALSGFRGAESQVDVDYGDGVEIRVALGLAGFGDTVVVTASRTPVRVAEAPVTTSVVSRERIATTGSGNVGELLRSVPGVNVVQLSARDISLTSRGATTPAANSQLVLVDGRSVYLDFFGAVLWDSLTVNQGDIEQIEVVRGPASVTWGANAMTGAVNIVTAEPRRSPGTRVSLWGGVQDRGAGSTAGTGTGQLFGSNVSVTRVPSEDLAYRISAGHYRADGLSRPVGQIPVVEDPRVRGATVGGGAHQLIPAAGTNQVKFDSRIDHRFEGGRGRLSYAGGVATTEGTAHTGLGPFDLQRGGYIGYSKLNYDRDALSLQFFTNFLDGEAPSLLLPDTSLGYRSQTFDLELVHRRAAGRVHRLTYGGNVRRVGFDVDIAAAAEDRLEAAGFVQDEIDTERYRAVLAARVDKFGNIRTPFVSPRVALGLKFGRDHVLTGSWNRAFRAPSAVESFMDQAVVVPIDLSVLRALGPVLPAFVPQGLPPEAHAAALGRLQAQLDATTSRPFPLQTRAIGGGIPLGGEGVLGDFVQEAVTAYELSYSGAFAGGRAAFGAAAYVSDVSNSIGLVPVAPGVDPYTAEAPPPGWVLPPEVLTFVGAFGGVLPRTSLAYRNLGPVRQVGAEVWLEGRMSRLGSVWANYSWQGRPSILEAAEPYPATELNLPPTHRVNVGAALDGVRYLGSASVNVSTRAFWSDVLTSEYHGYSAGYALVNATGGVKWRGGSVTTLVQVTNLFNQSIQQHVFGDLLRRSVVVEVRLDLQ